MSQNVKRTEVYLFYRLDAAEQSPLVLPEDPAFSAELWKPSLRTPWPHGACKDKKLHFLFRTLLQVTRMFPSNDSGALVLYEDARLVHYSAFTPRYWRFPFLTGHDLQVGDTWTEPSYRGKGLAKRALQRLVTRMRMTGRNFWYVVEDINRASVKVAEDCGFRLAGVGSRVERLKGLDYYAITAQKPGGEQPPQRAAGGRVNVWSWDNVPLAGCESFSPAAPLTSLPRTKKGRFHAR